jgi:hypothetical protein
MRKKLWFLGTLFIAVIVCAQDVQPPPPHQVILSWTAAPNVASCVPPCVVNYNVLRSTISGQETAYAVVDGGAVTTFIDKNAPSSTTGPVTYFYQIRTAFTSKGFVLHSNQATAEVSATFAAVGAPPFPPEIQARPQPPSGLTAQAVP